MEGLTFETVDWDHVYTLLLEIADRVKASRFTPDLIVGVARGGWLPARVLSDLLDTPRLASIRVDFYREIGQPTATPVITQPVSAPVAGKRVLVVDDITDSGQSFQLVWTTLAPEAAALKGVTLYHKPWSCFTPDIYGRETRAWVIFPWEYHEAVRTLGQRLLAAGKSLNETEAALITIGLRAPLVRQFLRDLYGRLNHD